MTKTHMLTATPEHRAWSRMKTRCFNPRTKDFADYGARGITMAPEWVDDFVAFLAHVGPRPSAQHSIDRKDNSLGYVPGNVRWATASEQARNRRSSHWITHDGVTATLAEWSERTGVGTHTIGARLRRGLTTKEAFDPVPPRKVRSDKRAA